MNLLQLEYKLIVKFKGENLRMKKLLTVILITFCIVTCGKKNQDTSDLVSDTNIKKQKIAKTKSISNSEEAYQLVRKSIIKHNLADINCITASEGEDENYYYFDIRSNNEKCGGDPSVAPRLFSYQVNKKTGKLKTDSMQWAEKIGKDPLTMEFHAID